MGESTDTGAETQPREMKKKFPFRKNILTLVGAGYAAVLIIFCVLAGSDPTKAFDAIEGPLMALIGGTLAVAKDLVDDPDK